MLTDCMFDMLGDWLRILDKVGTSWLFILGVMGLLLFIERIWPFYLLALWSRFLPLRRILWGNFFKGVWWKIHQSKVLHVVIINIQMVLACAASTLRRGVKQSWLLYLGKSTVKLGHKHQLLFKQAFPLRWYPWLLELLLILLPLLLKLLHELLFSISLCLFIDPFNIDCILYLIVLLDLFNQTIDLPLLHIILLVEPFLILLHLIIITPFVIVFLFIIFMFLFFLAWIVQPLFVGLRRGVGFDGF